MPNRRSTRARVDLGGGALTSGSTETVTAYDELGRRVAEYEQSLQTTPLSQRRCTRFVYDNAGRLVDVVDPAGKITSYSYDELGNQLTQTDAELHTTQYSYDNLGRRLTRTLPLGQLENLQYVLRAKLRS